MLRKVVRDARETLLVRNAPGLGKTRIHTLFNGEIVKFYEVLCLPHFDGCNPSKTRNAISKYVAAHGAVLPACIV